VHAWDRSAGWSEVHRHEGAAHAVALWQGKVVTGGADALVRGPGTWPGHGWDVHAVAAAGDTLVTAARDGALIVWDPAGTPRVTLHHHGGTPRCLAVSPDGALVASATRDDCIVVWAPDGTERARWTCDAPPHALAFADPRTLVVGDAGGEICVLRLS
jgi:WD40 repeat protein